MDTKPKPDTAPVADGQQFSPIASDAPKDEERREAVKAVKAGDKDPQVAQDATAWFLSEEDANVRSTKTIEIDVGATSERFVRWTIQSIPRERIRQIRNQSRVKRGRGMGDEINDTKANLMFATEGTVDPDIKAMAADMGAPPEALMERRMAHKPGLIDQIAGEVLGVSGYDDDDIRDVSVVRD